MKDFIETIRETVHSVLSPKPGSRFANVLADVRMAGYRHPLEGAVVSGTAYLRGEVLFGD